MSGDASAAALSLARTDPFPFAGEEVLVCGANALIAAAAIADIWTYLDWITS